MDAEEFLPRRTPGDPIDLLSRQDLEPLSVDELRQRIALLHAEIARVEAQLGRAVNHRASAEALFRT